MGRDVSYIPFTWQTQSTAQNRFLKFLLVVVLLFLLSFIIGFPESKSDTPQPESQEFPLKIEENQRSSFSEPETEDGETKTEETMQSISEKSIEYTTTSYPQNETNVGAFDNSVVPSGPVQTQLVENNEMNLEEGEKRIVESQENIEDIKKKEVTESVETTEQPTTNTILNGGQEEDKDKIAEIATEQIAANMALIEEKKNELEINREEPNRENENSEVMKQEETEETEIVTEQNGVNLASLGENGDEPEKSTEEPTTRNDIKEESNRENESNDDENENIAEDSTSHSKDVTGLPGPERPVIEHLHNCHIEDWNNVTQNEVPYQSVFKTWVEKMEVENRTDSNEGSPEILAAFAYKNQIAVTLSTRNFTSGSVYCQYYDCNKKQMVRQMPSFVFPKSTVYCPRRAGAKFISISETLEEAAHAPVQIMKRLVPRHFFTVCVSLNDSDENILKTARFIEYYKLQGSTFFHVYIQNSSIYQKMLLEDYIRTGDVKVIKIGDNVTEQVQANDCLHRNKYFSKWTAFLSLEDQMRLDQKDSTIASYLDNIVDYKVNILKWSSSNERNTSKLVIRPERIISINENPILVYLGNKENENDELAGVLEQFQTSTELTTENLSENVEETVPFREELIENIISRTSLVYKSMEMDSQKQKDGRAVFEQNSEISSGN